MTQIKLSDYVTQFLVDRGIRDVFLLSGGGMMHLLDSIQKQKELRPIFNLNEQASSICAEAYGQYTRHMGVCMVTTGPGATNAVTGCAGAWVASTPVLFISGQVKREQMGQNKGLRFYGLQEISIIPCVKPITKYAVTVMDKKDIRYHLEKAYYLATHGRKGPVWIDIPLDVQGSLVEETELRGYNPETEKDVYIPDVSDGEIKEVYALINSSRRPVFLIGNGVIASDGSDSIRYIVEKFNIPVLATWRAKGVFGDDERLFMGSPGTPTTRYSNYVLQNADLVIIIGSRLNGTITGYNERRFARNAKKIIVDIEEKEIEKLDMVFERKIVADAGMFLEKLRNNETFYQPCDRSDWVSYCCSIKKKYPLCQEIQPYDNEGKVDGFLFAKKLSDYSQIDDVFVASDSGRTCGISHMAYNLKSGQRFVESLSLGSMGWCLPSAIACCLASNYKRTVLMEGDGSLQHNLQELQLIQTYKLPIKLFVYENSGYASIYTMQRNNFEGRYCGCNDQSGLTLPSMKGIAELYGLEYSCITRNEDIDNILTSVMDNDRPSLCEVKGSIFFDEIPKAITVVNSDGTLSSSELENMYPFIDETEQKQNMPIWRD